MPGKNRIQIHQAKRNKYANEAQQKRICKLRKKYPNLRVVPHRQIGKYRFHALISMESRGGFWLSPSGRLSAAKPPNPQCFGNTADCVNNGYCMRSVACNE